MNSLTLKLPEIAGTQLLAFVLVASRVGGLFAFAPGFSSKLLPLRVRAVAALAFTLALAPVASAHERLPDSAGSIALAIAKETLVGLALAFAVGVVLAAVNAGAALLDGIVGFSFGATLDPFSGMQAAAFGQLYGMFATLVLLVTGGDQLMVLGFADSYRIVPLDGYPHLTTLAAIAEHGFAGVFLLALELTAPVVIALVVTEAGLGLIARAAPQMNVFVVGLPAKVGVAFAMAAVSLPFVAPAVQTAVENAVMDSLRLLGGG